MTGLLQAAEQGAVIVTANNRAARSLHFAFDRRQQELNRGAWRTPEILSWPAMIARFWSRLVEQAADFPLLLSTVQERALWQQVIEDQGESESARLPDLAINAWTLLHDYGAKAGPDEAPESPDVAAFSRWAEIFTERLIHENWTTAAQAPSLIEAAVQSGNLAAPKELIAVGFQEFTPQQKKLLSAFQSRGTRLTIYEPAECKHPSVAMCAPDRFREIEMAARWARVQVEAGAQAVAVITPDLDSCRNEIERTFRSALQPEACLPSQERPPAFHISFGRPLAEWPMVRVALLVLRWLSGPLPLADVGLLLRSSFLLHSSEEKWARARLDAELRRRGETRVETAELSVHAGWSGSPYYCPEFSRALRAKEFKDLSEATKAPSGWAQVFQQALERLGWPDGTLTSAEHQCLRRWSELLSSFASLDSVCSAMSCAVAVERIARLAETQPFAPEDEGAPVQVLGPLEAAGSEFDALWLMGIDADHWPPHIRPSPLLPILLQRRLNMPGCSPERDLVFAERLMSSLLRSTKTGGQNLVMSYAANDGERELRPAFVIAEVPPVPADEIAPEPPTWYGQQPELESYFDAAVPLQQSESAVASSAFKMQAACPFRAFAELRLHARELGDPEDVMGPLKRGNIAHTLMQKLWSDLQNHARLIALGGTELACVIERNVDAALAAHQQDFPEGDLRVPLLSVERERLQKLASEWLEIEKRRKPFAVLEMEKKDEYQVGPLRVRLRRDRVDQLEDGRRIIVDYKTGNITAHAWEGDRPDDPQLPLYAVTSGSNLAAIVFARLKAGEIGFVGLQTEPGLVPGAKLVAENRDARVMSSQIAEWEAVLVNLGEQFASGDAAVKPKTAEACRNCALPALCRISEVRASSEQIEAEDE